MGAWGAEIFENDDAADLAGGPLTNPTARITNSVGAPSIRGIIADGWDERMSARCDLLVPTTTPWVPLHRRKSVMSDRRALRSIALYRCCLCTPDARTYTRYPESSPRPRTTRRSKRFLTEPYRCTADACIRHFFWKSPSGFIPSGVVHRRTSMLGI
jgi:hypothetical protein